MLEEFKFFYLFSIALAAKSIWRKVCIEGLCRRVMTTKYLKGLSIEDWFILERNNTHGASIVWKGIEKEFPLVGN